MLMILLLFFILPFFILFLIFSSMGIIFIPAIFLLMSILAILIFSGIFYWIFLAFLVASLVYIVIHMSEFFIKKVENRKLFKFVIILGVIVLALVLMQSHFIHTKVTITNSTTGETIDTYQNVIN